MTRSPRFSAVAVTTICLVLAACAAPIQSGSPGASASPSGPPLRHVRLLLGFQPDVQFAPFYLAQQAGYYAAVGLEVSIEYKSDADLVRLVADGQAQFGVADATDVMISRTAGIPVKYVATLYDQFPVALIAPAGAAWWPTGTSTASLAGKTIGTPGKYGSSWHALLAILAAGGLTANDVTIREYPQYNQAQGLLSGEVDLITGFRNNEALRLQAQGMQIDMLTVEQIAPLPGPGVIAGDALIGSDSALVKAFVGATVRAQRAIATSPQVGLDAAVVAVPTIASDRATALAVLKATIELWRGGQTVPTGQINTLVWASGYTTMRNLGFIDGSVPFSEMFSPAVTGTD
jgi:NitT/TauT family transport system substrate-binding protein